MRSGVFNHKASQLPCSFKALASFLIVASLVALWSSRSNIPSHTTSTVEAPQSDNGRQALVASLTSESNASESTALMPPRGQVGVFGILESILKHEATVVQQQGAHMTTTTRGLFQDDFDSGNDVPHLVDVSNNVNDSMVTSLYHALHYFVPLSSNVEPNRHHGTDKREDFRFPTSSGPSVATKFRRGHHIFQSEIVRHSEDKASRQCFYRVTNACVIRGQLALFGPHAAALPHFRLCNELKGKVKLRFKVFPDSPALPPAPLSRQPAHVAACWQYYGFHLFQCLASLFTIQLLHNVTNVDMLLYNHAVSLPEASREHFSHQMFMGSAVTFEGSESEERDPVTGHRKYARNRYWAMWSQNTMLPSQISEVKRFAFHNDSSKDRCYREMLVGQPNHHALTNIQRRVHAAHVLLKLQGDSLFPPPYCTTVRNETTARDHSNEPSVVMPVLRITLVDRQKGKMQGGRRILNVPAVVDSLLREFFAEVPSSMSRIDYNNTQLLGRCWDGAAASFISLNIAERVRLCVVDWATLNLREQILRAQQTDVLIATHGGGNTWLAFQPRRSVLVELWHSSFVPRAVFLSLAKQHNIRYIPLLKDEVKDAGNFMHQAVSVDIPKLISLLQVRAFPFVVCARCGRC